MTQALYAHMNNKKKKEKKSQGLLLISGCEWAHKQINFSIFPSVREKCCLGPAWSLL
jgi:hypothetical protein